MASITSTMKRWCRTTCPSTAEALQLEEEASADPHEMGLILRWLSQAFRMRPSAKPPASAHSACQDPAQDAPVLSSCIGGAPPHLSAIIGGLLSLPILCPCSATAVLPSCGSLQLAFA